MRFLKTFSISTVDIAFYGMLNSLSQTLLKITAPGVPDFYQGSELWDLRLVDPDNRGTVDFARRIELLALLKLDTSGGKAEFAGQLLANWTDGRIKLYLISKALGCRQDSASYSLWRFRACANIRRPRRERDGIFSRFRKSEALVLAPKWLAGSQMEQNSGALQKFWGNTSIPLPE